MEICSKVIDVNFNNGNPIVRNRETIIHSLKPKVRFTCNHCKSVFSTTNWTRTKGGHYSASCPCCPYRAWAR